MVRNKPRLHLALYARPGYPDSYHYALIASSKDRSIDIVMYHTTNARRSFQGPNSQRWRHEKISLNSLPNEPRLLVVITIAKVLVPFDEITDILSTVTLYQPEDGEKYESFNCAEWTKAAIERLHEEKAISGEVASRGWPDLNEQALKFAQQQKEEGRWDDHGWTGYREIPCLDLFRKQ